MDNNTKIDDFITAKIKQHYSSTVSEQFSDALQKRLLQKLRFQQEEKKTNILARIMLFSIIGLTLLFAVVLTVSSTSVVIATRTPVLNRVYFFLTEVAYEIADILFLGETNFVYYLLVTMIGVVIFFVLDKFLTFFLFRRTS